MAVKGEEYYSDTQSGVRISLAAGREYEIVLPGVTRLETISYVPSRGKVLIGVRRNSNDGKEYRLLDPATGLSEKISGEFRPLTQPTSRPLQPTGNPNEFWAAIDDAQNVSTEVGRYDSKSFTFKPLIRFSRIRFNSAQMLVEETEGKIYAAYHGHLLRLPLK